jgi:hypothetical protein
MIAAWSDEPGPRAHFIFKLLHFSIWEIPDEHSFC